MKKSKITRGLYRVECAGTVYEVEDLGRLNQEEFDTPYRADWHVYEMVRGQREWCNDFSSLQHAIESLTR